MYLSDVDIRSKLLEMNFECPNTDFPLDPDCQIQPCSIDLRLSNVFWIPLKFNPAIDLRKSQLLELAPRRYWKQKVLSLGEYISLKPQTMILARTYEKFTIPRDCCGKIEGRSSFARLGLGIHCTGDFINPCYRGHMTLQIFNYSNSIIKLSPFIPICQLILIKTTSTSENTYGQKELQSKYMDDDGGPSYWWRDKRIKILQGKLSSIDIELSIQEEILKKLKVNDPETIERFEKYINHSKEEIRHDATMLLDGFIDLEKNKNMNYKMLRNLAFSIFPILASGSVGSFFAKPIGILHYILFIITSFSIFPFIHCIRTTERKYLIHTE